MQAEGGEVCPTIRAQTHGHLPIVVEGDEEKMDDERKVFDARGNGDGDISPTITRGRGDADDVHAICFNVTACDANGTRKDRPNGGLYVTEADSSRALTAGGGKEETLVCFQQNQRDEVRLVGDGGEIAGAIAANPGMKNQNYVASFMGGQGAKAKGIGYAEDVSATIKASPSGGNTIPDVVCVHGSQDPICSTEHANSVQLNNGLENCVCYPINSMVIGKELKDGDRQTTGIGSDGDPSPSILANQHHAVAIGVDCYNQSLTGGSAMTVGSSASDPHHIPCVAVPDVIATIDGDKLNKKERAGGSGLGVGGGEVSYTCTAKDVHGVVTMTESAAYGVSLDGRRELQPIEETAHTQCVDTNPGFKSGVTLCTKGNGDAFLSDAHTSISCGGGEAGQGYPACVERRNMRYAVRRLMPVECERLFGLPDGYTIPAGLDITDELVDEFVGVFLRWNEVESGGKPVKPKTRKWVRQWLEKVSNPETCPDAPRYKATGNSFGVNCVRWIGLGIQAVQDEIDAEERK